MTRTGWSWSGFLSSSWLLFLTATVRNLERDGVLTRHVYAEVPPRVEYELTPLGRGLTVPVLGLVSWLQANWPLIRGARDRFDARKPKGRV